MTDRKLITSYIDVPYGGVTLAWLKKHMENKIDAVLILEDSCIEYKEYESDAMYTARIQRENYERNLKNDPSFKLYLELKKRFYYYDR